ncbi:MULTISPECIES: DoxX family protein [unclassified Crossiella]|uniref:DoxX family protein n=1 Tax=unclassified Crossiella TaxID=2620835 RepID=UPI001FFED9D2|nr:MULTISPECIES: DoxX family protein [unclassified Crossiella]MCK2238414.1 DoxX family protein [Crossiella sp. S99.2]MCK2256454.1 DoxX family protein [Crossiella sp. S99.1]
MVRSAGFALLIGRIAVGLVFILHGWRKLMTDGMDATTANFGKLGFPAPEFMAWFTALVELLGGALFILGVALPLIGVLLAIVSVLGILFVTAKNGFWAGNGGYEYELVLAGTALALGFAGGEVSVGGYYRRRRHPVAA